MKYIVVLLLFISATVPQSSRAQHAMPYNRHNIPAKKAVLTPAKDQDSTLCFPLEKDHYYSLYSYIIDLERSDVRKHYQKLFTKYHYEFSGYVWEGILKDIISNAPDKEIANNVFIKCHSNIIGFTITRYHLVNRLPAYLCPILSNPKLLEGYIKKADRNRMPDY